jgi:alkaline phosphatase D
MKVNKPTVGPIIGYTTDSQSRLFLRGALEIEHAAIRRCFGVVQWRKPGGKWASPIFCKLSPNFDMTGVLVITGLRPSTTYEYQAGWFFADAELEQIEKLGNSMLDWREHEQNGLTFTTSTTNSTPARNYIVGSCRYLLRILGGAWFDDRGDKLFRSILDQIKAQQPVDALLMIGDQIYADDLNFVAPDTRLEQFLERYRSAFSQPYIKSLMSQVPTYMILDDHEIEDNWPASATEKDFITLYPQAIHAYQIYQCSHSPLFSLDNNNKIYGTPTRFWYTFKDGNSEWFVMDCRNERNLKPNQLRIVSEYQLEELLKWLNDGSGLVKFVVSSVPVFPDLNSDASDKWGAYPQQRLQILEHIRTNGIKRVVFVSGDVHCSFACELKLAGDQNFLAHSIVSSSFFWPYPHMHKGDFIFDRPLLGGGAGKYMATLKSDIHSDDNFTRLSVTLSTVEVSFFDRKGAALEKVIKLQL